MGRVLYVGNSLAGSQQDASLQAIIERRRHRVDYIDHATAEPSNLRQYDFIVISESVSSGTVGTKYVEARVPVLFLEPAILEEQGFCGERSSSSDGASFTTVLHGHPLAAGYTGGAAFSAGSGVYGITNFLDVGPSASSVIVTNTAANGWTHIIVIPKGGVRVGLGPAPALRIYWGAHSDSYNAFTEVGLQLINAALAMCERQKVQSRKRFMLSEAAGAGGQTITPSGISSAVAYGSHTVANVAAQTITPNGVASAAAYGSHTVANVFQSITPNGVTSAAAYGSHTVGAAIQQIIPNGIASAAAYGGHTLANVSPQAITPNGIASAAAYGTHTLADVLLQISPNGIVSAAEYGTHTLSGGVPVVSVARGGMHVGRAGIWLEPR